jgi:hypothetical protein
MLGSINPRVSREHCSLHDVESRPVALGSRVIDREWAEGDSREAMIAGGVTDRKKEKRIG